ncbi:MAG: leucine-rich repeat domain-containing protein, partial [Oscillospiraceae bacterium]|nr:leucine-rich repeat domain-containing protein [Oscillospiraceae bacterium]
MSVTPDIYNNANTPNIDFKCKMVDEEMRAFWPEWHVVRWIGGGSYGDVFHIARTNLGLRNDSALKVIQIMNPVEPKKRNDQEEDENDRSYRRLSGCVRDAVPGIGETCPQNIQNEKRGQISPLPESVYNEIRIMELLRGAPNVVTVEDYYYKEYCGANTPDSVNKRYNRNDAPYRMSDLYVGEAGRLYVRMELLTSFKDYLLCRPDLKTAMRDCADRTGGNGKRTRGQYYQNPQNQKYNRNREAGLSKSGADRGDIAGNLSVLEICRIAADICTALDYCEKYNIIHRDIKPANMFVDRFGNYKLGDFGASRSVESLQTAHTMTGIGTISYMAPEIYNRSAYDHTVDIYALGLVLYQLLNHGRMPFLPDCTDSFTTADVDTANYRRLHGHAITRLKGVDPELDRIVRKACAYNAEDRYRTAAQMKREIEDYLNEKMRQKNRAERENEGKELTRGALNTADDDTATIDAVNSGETEFNRSPNTTQRIQSNKKQEGTQSQDSRQPAGERQKQDRDNRKNDKKSFPRGLFILTAALICCVMIELTLFKKGNVDSDEHVQADLKSAEQSLKSEESAENTNTRTIIDIPDPVLKEAIQNTLGTGNREITGEDASSLTSLECKGDESRTIKDITGLSAFSNLMELDMGGNQIEDIGALSSLKNLKKLVLDKNQIKDISVLSGLTNLTTLSLRENEISDISAVSNLMNVTNLNLSYNQFSDIRALSGLSDLNYLDLRSNEIADYSVLSGLTNLIGLNLSFNKINDLSVLSELTNLTKLYLGFCKISDISALSSLTNLTSLDLVENQISDISALSSL